MTQPVGNPNLQLLVMAAPNQCQAPVQPMVPGPTQPGVTLIQMTPQHLQQCQYVQGGQLPQLQPAYVLQTTGVTPLAEGTQYVVQQPMQYFNQPQLVLAPGQQSLSTNQQSTLVSAGGQQLIAMNSTTPAYVPANQIQYVPANTQQCRRPLSPPKGLWNTQSGQPIVPTSPPESRADRHLGVMSPKPTDHITIRASPKPVFRLPFQEIEIKVFEENVTKATVRTVTKVTNTEAIKAPELEISDWLPEEKENRPVGGHEETNSEENMVPISLKNNYDHLKYDPELERKYFGEDLKIGWTIMKDEFHWCKNKRFREYLRNRPLVRISPPTPMHAVYRLRKQNWDRKLKRHDNGRVAASRGFRNLSDLLGSMDSETFTRMDKGEFRNSHRRRDWSKTYPRMMSSSDSDDYDGSGADEEVFFDRDDLPRQDRLQSFGFATPSPNRQAVQTTPGASQTDNSQFSAMSSEGLKDSAFSEESTPEGPDRSGKIPSSQDENVGKDTLTVPSPKMKRTKSGKNIWKLIEKANGKRQKIGGEFYMGNYVNSREATRKIPDDLECMVKRSKHGSPRFTKKVPVRKPNKRHAARTPGTDDDWLERASFLASSACKRSGSRRRVKSRNL